MMVIVEVKRFNCIPSPTTAFVTSLNSMYVVQVLNLPLDWCWCRVCVTFWWSAWGQMELSELIDQ